MASFQVEKPLKYSGKGPVMRSMYWDILELHGRYITQTGASVETRRDGVKESSKRRWYLSESGKVKWGKKFYYFREKAEKLTIRLVSWVVICFPKLRVHEEKQV